MACGALHWSDCAGPFGLGTAVILIAYLVEFVSNRAMAKGWNFTLQVIEQQSVLILRSVGDEAAGVLGAAHIASWVLEAVWGHARRLLQMTTWIALGVMVVTGVGISQAERLGFTASGSSAAVEDGLTAGFVSGTLVIGAVVVGLLATMALYQLPFGRDALVLTLRAITTLEDSPPGNQTVQQVSLAAGVRGLAHSRLYEQLSVIQSVVTFVASRSTARNLKYRS